MRYLLTEGLPALCLMVVGLTLARSTRHARTRAAIAVTSTVAAAVSLIELVLRLGVAHLVASNSVGDVGQVYAAVARLDGVKVLLLAVLASATGLAIRRRALDAPKWVEVSAALTLVTMTASALGYLFLVDTLALAAWASLPCLIVFVTGSGISLSPSAASRRTARSRCPDDPSLPPLSHGGRLRTI